MLQEFVEKIRGLAVDAAQPKLMDIGDPRRKLLVYGNETKEVLIEPAVRCHKVADLDSFVTAVQRFSDAADCVVWHNFDQVVAILNDEDRRDRVTLELSTSELFSKIFNLDSQYSQTDFVELLRHKLNDVLGELLPKVRKIEVATGSRRNQEVNPGRERGTAEFSRELAEADKLPETVHVPVPVYTDRYIDMAQRVRLSLNFNLQTLTFSLQPLPDEHDKAIDAAQRELHDWLRGELPEDVAVLYGTP